MADILVPVGTIVSTYNTTQPDRVIPSDLVDYLFDNPPIGVMLTNAVNVDVGGGAYTGGYCIVSTGGNVVMFKDATSPAAAAGDKLYVGPTPGAFTTTPPARTTTNDGPILVGRAHALGPGALPASDYCYAAWIQSDGRHIFLAAEANGVSTNGSTVNFLMLPVRAGGYYLFEVNMSFACGDGGVDVLFTPPGSVANILFDAEIVDSTPSFIYESNGNTSFALHVGASGAFVDGVFRLRGHFKSDATGNFVVVVSQHASSANATTYMANSYLRLHEQG